MNVIEVIRQNALKAGVNVPKHINSITGIYNYLKAQLAVLTMTLAQKEEEVKALERRIEALREVILYIDENFRRGGKR